MELAVTKRDLAVKPKALREQGLLPAVVYGRKDESTPVSLDRKAFEKVFRTAGESTVITLTGLGEQKEALIHEVEFDVVTGTPIHVDLYAIAKGQKVTVSVPLEFVGVSPAVKDLGAVLVKVMHQLEIEVAPKDLPHSIAIDISSLATIDDKIFVKDIVLPASATPTADLDEVVAMAAQVAEETEEAAPMDLSQIEVEKKGKKEEEEAPAA